MAKTATLPGEEFRDIHFPAAGLDLSLAYSKQPNRPVHTMALQPGQRYPTTIYARTTRVGNNVRGYEPGSGRKRGGQRPGLSKYLPQQLVGGGLVQELAVIVRGGGTAPGGHTVQTSQSGRIVVLVAVTGGNVYAAIPGDTTWTAATNNASTTPPLNSTGLVYSATNQQILYFADGTHYVTYDPSANTVQNWVASSGTLPVDASGNTPRLICTWRGRTVVSGLIFDPQNWFMSAVGDPTNWNYSPLSTTPTQAIAGNNAPQGLIGDVVTNLIPYTDDVLVFGGDHTIYMMRGDPMAGGQIDLISDAIGMAWGQAWTKDPMGVIYFVSNKTGIYSLVPGQQPQRISQQIDQLLLPIDTGANAIRLIWNDRFQGLHVFVSPLAAAGASTHFFYEQRSGAWWTDTLGSTNLDPLCCATFDGNLPGDRVPLIGSWDGYVRKIDFAATTDDGFPISSQVFIGPFVTEDFDDILVKDLQGVLGETSGTVTYAVYSGTTAEKALSSTPVATGTWSAGRNLTNMVRRSGHAHYIGISSTNQWAMEAIRARVATLGKVRRRGR